MDCINRNGDVTGYSVQYGVQGSGHSKILNITGGQTTEVIICDLDSATNYSIEVAAVNSAGTGVYSAAIYAVTIGICNVTVFSPCTLASSGPGERFGWLNVESTLTLFSTLTHNAKNCILFFVLLLLSSAWLIQNWHIVWYLFTSKSVPFSSMQWIGLTAFV